MDEFEQRWLAFVRRFADAPPQERDALVADVLEHGLPEAGSEHLLAADLPTADRVAAEMAVVAASGEFDPFGYWWHNQDRAWNLCGYPEELRHFVTQGWKELRHPSPSFDLWFYWSAHLDPTSEAVNPLLHYLCEGRRAGLPTLPEVRTLPAATVPTSPVRRVCLFAAYDVDGVVDPTVVDYLADLSRHADVYYLADCEMDDAELDKVAPYTKGRWAIRHGRYDFGSYSLLARDLVGWDVIEAYDELLLANDSCYLVQPFDQVFARMDATACDWWGLQATYEDFTAADFERLGRPLAIDDVEEQMRQIDLWRYNDFIHVGSYFVAYRKRVHRRPRVPGPARQRRRADRQDDDHPQVRDRLLPAADPGRAPPRDVRRRDPALPPGLPGVGLRPDARRLPAAQAPVPLREPLLPPGPAEVEGAGARDRPRRPRGGDGAQPAPGRAGVETAPQLLHHLAAGRDGRGAAGHRARRLRRRGPLDPHAPALVGLPGRRPHRGDVR